MRSRIFRAAFCRMPAHSSSFSSVMETEGPVLLLAVPGSGKTTVLVTRLGYMALCCGIDPARILAVTYTVAATRELRARFTARFPDLADAGVPHDQRPVFQDH